MNLQGSRQYEWPETFAVKEITPDAQERSELEQTFAKEAENLRAMSNHRSDHIIRFATAFTLGDDEESKRYFLVFEWADGGCLEELFKGHQNPTLTKGLIQSAVKQIEGLARALQMTHDKAQIRHGDLKPGNILRFNASDEDIIGTLKIGDWGLAKYHAVATELRGEHTLTIHGTAMYEPPEVDPNLHIGLDGKKVFSRQYDVWSMGCIILEVIIWLLYGYNGVEDFRIDVRNHKSTNRIPCYDVEVVKGSDPVRYKAKVRPIVTKWMDHLAGEALCGANQALGALLRIVREDLLNVDLPTPRLERSGSSNAAGGYSDPNPVIPGISVRAPTFREEDNVKVSTANTRATSQQLLDKLLSQVVEKGSSSSDWWFKPGKKAPSKPNFASGSSQDAAGNLSPAPGGPRHRAAGQTVTPSPILGTPTLGGGLEAPSPGRLSVRPLNTVSEVIALYLHSKRSRLTKLGITLDRA